MNTKAIVTGHSRGLGAGIVEALARRGVPTLAIARNTKAVSATSAALTTQERLDLADLEALRVWLSGPTLREFLSGADRILLVNNAGMLQPIGPLALQDVATIAQAVALNVSAPLMLSSALVQASPKATDRRILHISSGAGRKAYAGWSVYCATKAALDHHARAVSLDLSAGVRISSIAPGVIDTDMQTEIRDTTFDRFPMRERFRDMKRTGTLVDPGDAGESVVSYLLNDEFGSEPVADVR